MTTVSYNDLVQASTTFEGHTVASFSASGFNSINGGAPCSAPCRRRCQGLLSLSVRNATRGWKEQRALFVMP